MLPSHERSIRPEAESGAERDPTEVEHHPSRTVVVVMNRKVRARIGELAPDKLTHSVARLRA
jgi:hypothetical protein